MSVLGLLAVFFVGVICGWLIRMPDQPPDAWLTPEEYDEIENEIERQGW